MASKFEITAADGSKVAVLQAQAGDTAQGLAEQLALPKSDAADAVDAVVVLAGGAAELDERRRGRLTQLFGRGLLRALGEFKGLCVLRGADDRVAELVGVCARDALRKPLLLGVAPAGQLDVKAQPPKPALVPALSHLFVAEGAHWGDERRATIELMHALTGGRHAMLLLVGGVPADLGEVLQAVRRRWPIVVIKGSGGAADALVAHHEAKGADLDDPLVAEILADGKLTVVDLDDKIAVAVEVLTREVERACGGLSVLRQVWQRFAAIDEAAIRQQRVFMLNQTAILVVGVAAVVLAAIQTLAGGAGMTHNDAAALASAAAAASASTAGQGTGAWATFLAHPLRGTLSLLLVVVPIFLSILVAGVNRFSYGKRWVLLRAAAEGIKREIYLYRLHSQGYASNDKREKQLKMAVEDVTRRLARTEVNTLALPPYQGPIPPKNSTAENDDGMSLLSTDQYVRLRLQNQLSFYRRKSVGLETTMKRTQYAVLVVGGFGTLFGALGDTWVIWIASTTTVASALASYLTFKQVETTLMSFNQTATDLENIEAWWLSLDPEEQKDAQHIEHLGKFTERILETEVGGWSQRMSDALEKLREASTRDGGAGGGGAGGVGTTSTERSLLTRTDTVEVSTRTSSETELLAEVTLVDPLAAPARDGGEGGERGEASGETGEIGSEKTVSGEGDAADPAARR